MSEELIRDPSLEKLARFTPISPNRDALLFEAGRASAKPNRVWKWLVIGLLISHGFSFLLWCWPKPTNRVLETTPPVQSLPSESVVEPNRPASPTTGSYLAYWQEYSETGELAKLTTQGKPTKDNPPLTAFSSRLPLD
jgi:hypothetical protein